jgi:hypothetical protein
MSGCNSNSLEYIFDVEGHTRIVCTYDKRPISYEKGRKLCPHYGGKCPAVVNKGQ